MPISGFCEPITGKNRLEGSNEFTRYQARRVNPRICANPKGFRCCVFQVPKSITDLNPEAYAPQKIGFGPFHHFRSHLCNKMEMEKKAVTQHLKDEVSSPSLWDTLLSELDQEELMLRGLYDNYIEKNDGYINMPWDMFSWVLATDTLYLLHLLGTNIPNQEVIIAEDIMMLENQIPFALLRSIEKSWGSPSGDITIESRRSEFSQQIEKEIEFRMKDYMVFTTQTESFTVDNSDLLYVAFSQFCDTHSPFHLAPETRRYWLYCYSHNPLDYMYNLTVDGYFRGHDGGDTPESEKIPRDSDDDLPYQQHSTRELIGGGTVSLASLFLLIENFLPRVGLPSILVFHMFIKSLPWASILVLFQYALSYYKKKNNKRDPLVRNIKIAAALDLQKIGGVGFEAILGFEEKIEFSKGTLKLRQIKLKTSSEVFLRNMVAQEAFSPHWQKPLTDYFAVMFGLIQTTADVKVLQDNNIIINEANMSNDKILKFFEGIGKTTGSKLTTEDSQKTIDDIKNHFDSRLRVKVVRLMSNSWKFVCDISELCTFFISVFLILYICFKEYCKAYGSPPFCRNLEWTSDSSHTATHGDEL